MSSKPRSGLLRQHDFRLLWAGETTSRFGSNITGVAMPLVAVVTLDASTFWVSALAAAAWLPWLLIGLLAGAWVDRLPRRPLMVACNLVSLVFLLSVPAAAWLGVLTMGQLLVVSLLTGLANVFFSIAYRVYLPFVVSREHLTEANAKLQGSESAAQLAGLGGGGALAGAFGAVTGLLADAATFLTSTLCLLGIRATEPPPKKPEQPTALRKDVAEGLRHTVRDPYLRVLTTYGTVTNLLLTGYQAILTVFLVRELHVGEAALGWLLAGSSIGGLLGAVVATAIARRFGTARGMLLCKFATAPFGLLIPLAEPGWRVVLLPLGGAVLALGVVSANVIQGAFRQTYCPPELLGRITASVSVANFGAIPIGSLLGGVLGSLFGLRPTLWLLTAGLAVSSVLLLAGPLRGRRDLPTEPPQPAPDYATPEQR
ncbi:MFS transporter [Streptomyces sp. NBC_01754]|uniref:MFS transporter n=1 Tax=Streptomyces sp. NBC_01754 TaxID=2975930 RepID=UPI002DD891C0|nr:MFS transporter [Streptomyces sp. NBC_01754]WSC90850.1 MFS transporter [Streptomyces sp. NBC_01754]WSC96655.1 MFS transporter [Streptomyces sp. NBC_01754]